MLLALAATAWTRAITHLLAGAGHMLVVAIPVVLVSLALAYPLARNVHPAILAAVAVMSPTARALGVLGLGAPTGPITMGAAYLAGAAPLTALLVHLRLRHRPAIWLEAAADLGAEPWRRFTEVELAWIRPALSAAAVWITLTIVGDVVIADLAGGGLRMGPGGIARDALREGNDVSRALVMVVGMLLPALALGWVVARDLLEPFAPDEASRRAAPPTGAAKGIAWGGLLVCLVPLVGLIPGLSFPARTEASATLADTIGPTATLATLVTPVAVLLAFGLSSLVIRTRHRGVVALALCPLALPSAVLGVAWATLARQVGWAPGLGANVVAHLAPATSLAFVGIVLTLSSVDPDLPRTAADLGANQVERIRWVWGPVAVRAAGIGSALCVAWIFGEAAIAMFAAGPGGSTLPMALAGTFRAGDVGTLSRWSLAVSLLPLVVAIAIARPRRLESPQ